jgi:hypothetical protein
VLIAGAVVKAGVGRFDLGLDRLLIWAGRAERGKKMVQGEREKEMGQREKGSEPE